MPSPLITAAQLRRRLDSGAPITLLDVRWDLAHGARPDLFAAGHLPGAAFVDLARDLAGEPGPRGEGGRHPLPDPARFVAAMRVAGVGIAQPVVLYDGTSGLAAARGWWLLRHYGHPDVAVLDGGITAWTAAGGELETGTGEQAAPGDFDGAPGAMPVLDAAGAATLASNGVLLDARAGERYRGEAEPIDPVAGHIPGAVSRPTTDNLAADGRFADPAMLRAAFAATGAGRATPVGVYCGSGVTAAHEVLALELAGLRAALYAGSWSDWVSDRSRPVAR